MHIAPSLHGMTRAAFHYAFPRLAYRRLTSQAWREKEVEMDLLPALVDPMRDAIDVGANVGHYAVRLSRLVKLVHAFEPHPRLAYVLRRCLPANVVVRDEAVSDRRGTAILTIPFFERPVEGMSTLTANESVFENARGLTRVQVSTTTLDEFADQDIGFVKIDVEGHESHVLSGADLLVSRQRPVFLVEVEERHRTGSVRTVAEYFSARGYRGFFAWKSDLLPLDTFTTDMQSLDLLVAASSRTSYDYVNNFFFLPREGWSPHRDLHLRELLRTAHAETSREATADKKY